MAVMRRARGAILRLARRRWPAILVGVALAGPAAWIEWSGRGGTWWVDGLSLVVGATGLALLWTGLTGIAPDWVDDEGDRRATTEDAEDAEEDSPRNRTT
jgi:hypothetical protein